MKVGNFVTNGVTLYKILEMGTAAPRKVKHINSGREHEATDKAGYTDEDWKVIGCYGEKPDWF